jgi:Dolichyl-phosphate-mannose-protein mannosyltransferase
VAQGAHSEGTARGRRVELRGRSIPLARALVVVASLVPTAVYLYVALHRIGYPYELEWLEGGAVEIVRRVAEGQAIYVRPSVHYVPYPYTPLYFWVSGALAHVNGVGFLPLRLVSLLSSLGCCAVLIRIVWSETGDPVAGILASGLFTASFAVSGAWFDIGRVDSFSLLLLLLAISTARRAETISRGIGVGVLVFLAFMAKQDTLIATAPVLVLLIVTKRRAGAAALTATVALLVGSTAVLNATTHDWYGYYVFDELAHQGLNGSAWTTFFTKSLMHEPWALVLGLTGLAVAVLLRRREGATGWLFWSVAVGGLLASSLLSRLHSGGGPDVLMPAFAGMAIYGALGYDVLRREAAGLRADGSAGPLGRGRQVAALAAAFLAAVVAVQIVALHYDPARYIPSSADQAAGDRFISLVRHTPGAVIVADHPDYDTLAGKASWAQGEALHDVIRAGPSVARRDLIASIESFMKSPQPATVYSDDPGSALGSSSLPYFHRSTVKVFACHNCFYPVTDIRVRPGFLFVRR